MTPLVEPTFKGSERPQWRLLLEVKFHLTMLTPVAGEGSSFSMRVIGKTTLLLQFMEDLDKAAG